MEIDLILETKAAGGGHHYPRDSMSMGMKILFSQYFNVCNGAIIIKGGLTE